jgi:uncharacterized protein YcbX
VGYFYLPDQVYEGRRLGAKVLERGFQYDRRWMLVDRGRIIHYTAYPSSDSIDQVELQDNHLLSGV